MGSNPVSDSAMFIAALEALLEESLVVDAVVAKSEPPTAYTQHWKS